MEKPAPQPEAPRDDRDPSWGQQLTAAAEQGEQAFDDRLEKLEIGFDVTLAQLENDKQLQDQFIDKIATELWPHRQNPRVERILRTYGYDPDVESADQGAPVLETEKQDPIHTALEEFTAGAEQEKEKFSLSGQVHRLSESVRGLVSKITGKFGNQDMMNPNELAAVEIDKDDPESALYQLTSQLAIIQKYNANHLLRRAEPEVVERVEAQLKEAYDALIAQELSKDSSPKEIFQKLNDMRALQAELGAELRTRDEKVLEKWRHHPKYRFAIGLAITGVGVGAAATGVGGVALAAGFTRAGLGAVNGYFGSKMAQEAGGQYWSRRKSGELGETTASDAVVLRLEGITQRLAAVGAAEAGDGRSQSQAEHDKALEGELQLAERAWVKGLLERSSDPKEVYMQLIEGRLSASLVQTEKDRGVHQRRTAISGAVALALGVVGGARAVEHAVGGIDKAQTPKSGSGQLTPEAPHHGISVAPDHVGEHHHLAEHGLHGHAVEVKHGDSVWAIAERELERQDPDFRKTTGFSRIAKVDRLKDLMITHNNLSNPNLIFAHQKLTITRSMLSQASGYHV